ncbi:MAG: recombinase family protein [Methyloglobulus sp.]|nr:recombinase family protein [Methyloglobulus sp.]NOU21181.1 recombinase family protein [Methyloglobulus sp.]
MKGHRIGYIRVSSYDQNLERQLDGIPVDKVFEDKASGKDKNRPGLDALTEFVREGDTVVVHSLDRLARNLSDLLHIVQGFVLRGIAVEFVKENLKFTKDRNSFDDLMLSVLGAVAQFERAMIGERQREGIALAKKRGVYDGKVRKRKLSDRQINDIEVKLGQGVPKSRVAKEFGITRETLYQYLKLEVKIDSRSEKDALGSITAE